MKEGATRNKEGGGKNLVLDSWLLPVCCARRGRRSMRKWKLQHRRLVDRQRRSYSYWLCSVLMPGPCLWQQHIPRLARHSNLSAGNRWPCQCYYLLFLLWSILWPGRGPMWDGAVLPFSIVFCFPTLTATLNGSYRPKLGPAGVEHTCRWISICNAASHYPKRLPALSRSGRWADVCHAF